VLTAAPHPAARLRHALPLLAWSRAHVPGRRRRARRTFLSFCVITLTLRASFLRAVCRKSRISLISFGLWVGRAARAGAVSGCSRVRMRAGWTGVRPRPPQPRPRRIVWPAPPSARRRQRRRATEAAGGARRGKARRVRDGSESRRRRRCRGGATARVRPSKGEIHMRLRKLTSRPLISHLRRGRGRSKRGRLAGEEGEQREGRRSAFASLRPLTSPRASSGSALTAGPPAPAPPPRQQRAAREVG